MIERIDPIPNQQGAPGVFGNGLAELYFDNVHLNVEYTDRCCPSFLWCVQ